MPSRDFMVRQAVLTAAAELFPMAASKGRLRALMEEQYHDYTPRLMAGSLLARETLKAYRGLVEKYGHPEPDVTAYDGHSQRI